MKNKLWMEKDVAAKKASKTAEKEPLLEKQLEFSTDPLNVRAKQQEKVEWIPEIENLQGESAIGRAGCCSRLFFSWTRPFIKVSIIRRFDQICGLKNYCKF